MPGRKGDLPEWALACVPARGRRLGSLSSVHQPTRSGRCEALRSAARIGCLWAAITAARRWRFCGSFVVSCEWRRSNLSPGFRTCFRGLESIRFRSSTNCCRTAGPRRGRNPISSEFANSACCCDAYGGNSRGGATGGGCLCRELTRSHSSQSRIVEKTRNPFCRQERVSGGY